MIVFGRLFVAVFVCFIYVRFGGSIPEDRLVTLAQLFASVAGVFLGFLLTAVALVASLGDRILISNLKKTGHFARMMRDAFTACRLLLAVTVLSLTVLFGDPQSLRVGMALVVFLSVLACLYAVQCASRFAAVIQHL
jgi:hypothetical protein